MSGARYGDIFYRRPHNSGVFAKTLVIMVLKILACRHTECRGDKQRHKGRHQVRRLATPSLLLRVIFFGNRWRDEKWFLPFAGSHFSQVWGSQINRKWKKCWGHCQGYCMWHFYGRRPPSFGACSMTLATMELKILAHRLTGCRRDEKRHKERDKVRRLAPICCSEMIFSRRQVDRSKMVSRFCGISFFSEGHKSIRKDEKYIPVAVKSWGLWWLPLVASLPSMFLVIVFEKEWKRGKPLKGKDAQLKFDAMKTIKRSSKHGWEVCSIHGLLMDKP